MPPGTFCLIYRLLLVVTTEGSHWHLVGRGRDAGQHPTVHRMPHGRQ